MAIHICLEDPTPEHRHLLSTISTHISKSKRSVIVTGAGISCNAGIPVHACSKTQLTGRTFAHKMGYTILSKQNTPNQ
jgi:hypothetical protein